MGRQSRALTTLATWLLPIFLLTASLAAVAEVPFPRGQITPRVICRASPGLSYALYLPNSFREDRPMPVLFGFSPGGSGREPVELFAAAAESFGFILVGSNDARNGSMEPILQAQAALWKDVHERFKVDPQRSYSVGFSGGARMALRLAKDHIGDFAGVISFGAFGSGEAPARMGHVGFVLACGEEDFNHWELLQGAASLRSKSWKVMEDRYPKGHLWAPEELCTESLAFLQVLAMERGLVPVDTEFRTGFLTRRRGTAEAAEASGDLLLAKRRWENIAASFPTTREGLEARQRSEALSRLADLKAELKLEAKFERKRFEFLRLQGTSFYMEDLFRLHDRIPKAPPQEVRNIRRLLSTEAMKFQAAAMEAMQAKDWERAAGLLSTQEAFQDREPWPCLYLAAVFCRMGRLEEAMAQLKEGQRRGFRQVHTLRDSELLKDLRGRPDFERFLDEMGR